jgi:hypothetical protein
MNTTDNGPVPKGARVLPGVDLTLWLNLVLLALLTTALIAGGVAVAVR